jgi:hypothetical protein
MAHLAGWTWRLVIAVAVVAGPAGSAVAQVEPAPLARPVSEPPGEAVRYGIGLRLPRWVTVPDWLLGAFFAQSVPLSTLNAYGIELFRRKGSFDIVIGLAYQNMSTDDGNWLARGQDPALDTDLVQFRGLSILGVDAAFVGRRSLHRYVGLRYGAGLGLAFIRGKLLRTSSAMCTAANAGDPRACRPRICSATGCSEAELAASEGEVDGGPAFPHRFAETNVPGALPIINLSLGLDFRVPELPGFEARLEGGVYDALFLGLGFSYTFR